MKIYLRFIVVCVFAFAKAFTPMMEAQIVFTNHKIIDSIPVKMAIEESYALYLGKGYNPYELSPVLFVFSPTGVGKQGIKPFIKAADDMGMIVVCSNNSKNGSYEQNFQYAQNLFTEILTNYKVDEEAIYLAGFSGGSRLATAIACLTPNVRGVIGVGAGFSSDPTHIPSTQDFAYLGVSGDEDFNYLEMVGVREYLQKTNIRNSRLSFDGKHQWPPQELMQHAFRWFLMDEQRKTGNVFSLEEVESYCKTDLQKAIENEEENQLVEAVEWYEHILPMYKGLVPENSMAKDLKKLRKSREYKNQLKERIKAHSIELESIGMLVTRLEIDYHNVEKVDYEWWSTEIAKIRSYKLKSKEFQRMSTRLSWTIYANAASRTNPNLYTTNPKQKAFCDHIIELLKAK